VGVPGHCMSSWKRSWRFGTRSMDHDCAQLRSRGDQSGWYIPTYRSLVSMATSAQQVKPKHTCDCYSGFLVPFSERRLDVRKWCAAAPKASSRQSMAFPRSGQVVVRPARSARRRRRVGIYGGRGRRIVRWGAGNGMRRRRARRAVVEVKPGMNSGAGLQVVLAATRAVEREHHCGRGW
jgi:hypothetical protein